MGVRHLHPHRFRTALPAASLVALLTALAVACGSASSASPAGGTPGGQTPGSGTSGGQTPGSGTPGSGTPGSGTSGRGTGSGSGTGGAASCAYFTQPGYLAMARVVFVGTLLPGRTINGPRGLLVSPARVKVARYIKGSGPAVVTVETAVSPSGDGIGAEGVMARPGQTWRIYTTSGHLPFETGVCSGSRLVGAAAP